MRPIRLVILLVLIATPASGQVAITIDSTTKFQTIEGWGHGGDLFSNLNYGVDPAIRDSLNHQILDYMIDDLGLTGSRIWEVGPRIDGTGMDNGDCDSIDWSKFQLGPVDTMIANYMVYFKNRVNTEGYQTSFYSSPTYPSHATNEKPWVLNHPGERAQQIWAGALWWKQNYGIDINYAVIYNEPGGVLTSQLLADDVKALGPRLKKLGLATKSQFAEGVAPLTDWNFITPVTNDTELWANVGRISYHNYGTADPYRADLRDFAKLKGITTAQTEMASPTIDDIFNDMLFGGVGYWEVGFSGSSTLVNVAGNTSFTPSGTYFRLHQAIHYIRPGDLRIGCVSSDTLIRVLAFSRKSASVVLMLNGDVAKSVTLSGLIPGKYGLSQSIAGGTFFTELGLQTVTQSGILSLNIGGGGIVTTLYPYAGTNHAPTIMTCSAAPGYLVEPASSVALTANASDPERDPLTYKWTVYSQPTGANVTFTTPNTATTNANGMTVAGNYIFQISVSDGFNTSSKKVYVIAYPTNPPPQLGPAGFRINMPYGLVFGAVGEVTHANVELPTSAATLQIGIGDLQNSSFYHRGLWTLVSQPAGANVILDTTTYIFVSIRANVSNMTVPGDYVFHLNISTPNMPDQTARVIFTVHPASAAPVINSIAATPALLTLPQDSSQLTATTTNPEGQLLRHWWAIKAAPNGAHPQFDHQGLPNTRVSALDVPGTYVFTLRSFDDIHMTTKDVSVVILKSVKAVYAHSQKPSFELRPNPANGQVTILMREHSEAIDLKLIDVLGEPLREFDLAPNATEFDLSVRSLPAGIYFVQFQSKLRTERQKLVIQ